MSLSETLQTTRTMPVRVDRASTIGLVRPIPTRATGRETLRFSTKSISPSVIQEIRESSSWVASAFTAVLIPTQAYGSTKSRALQRRRVRRNIMRLRESPEERNQRLLKQRDQKRLQRSRETPEQRTDRLKRERENKKRRLVKSSST